MVRQFSSYAMVGVVGFLVNATSVELLSRGVDLYSAGVLAWIIAATSTWALNRSFTFRRTDRSAPLAQWARFLVANLGGFCLSYCVFVVTVRSNALAHEFPALAVALGSIAGLAVNYTMARRLVFR